MAGRRPCGPSSRGRARARASGCPRVAAHPRSPGTSPRTTKPPASRSRGALGETRRRRTVRRSSQRATIAPRSGRLVLRAVGLDDVDGDVAELALVLTCMVAAEDEVAPAGENDSHL